MSLQIEMEKKLEILLLRGCYRVSVAVQSEPTEPGFLRHLKSLEAECLQIWTSQKELKKEVLCNQSAASEVLCSYLIRESFLWKPSMWTFETALMDEKASSGNHLCGHSRQH
ncbi:uncharacterized protein LOC122065748 [Macadamia integrifolia]|uniref:uncharacterized protein LOC122065748 n=1 Tax=Macadamia integrifolia TaxID=60698 RepID=UPI001C4F7D64|nr:uncharacterized protein LOC122065748 [Macadamia integrifolia]